MPALPKNKEPKQTPLRGVKTKPPGPLRDPGGFEGVAVLSDRLFAD
jgi:hypothetical protein